ncbi:hypothetical protein BGZ96_012321 [Linnemannia gamsii]|uniref:Chromatin target of PRMT1 protein C-terminal domain-containing protein n=1 Tax=Linnemannia gamsii TaxID=64522 RepID=A0ABQ7JQN5_9FUNG|nr:hypothetical protein BGZ96_012321 [Linnemannia gamsii]
MASKNGQILYLGGSSGSQSNAGGSLSTRFQKLAQSRNSGITVVNPSTGIESRPGRSLGLGFGTGSHPQGPGGHRISTAAAGGRSLPSTGRGGGGAGHNNNTRGGGRGGRGGSGLVPGGLHTAGGLARAMQERGTGVSDAFLFAPEASLAGASAGASRRGRRLPNAAAAGGVVIGDTRASRHKALVLGGRPGRKQQAAPVVSTPHQHRQRGGPAHSQTGAGVGAQGSRSNAAKAAKAAKVVGGGGGGAKAVGAQAGKGKKDKKAKPTPVNAGELDSELDAYMMKDKNTASSVLDNDLDSYMADKPAENSW